jgi:hypothetical protein
MQSARRLFILVSALVVALVAVWLLVRERPSEPIATAPAEEEAPPAAEEAPRLPRRAPAPPPPEPAPPPLKEEIVTSDGLPIMPARGEATGPAHPHPITPQHQRIYGENRLVGAIEGAMDVKDTAGMRRLLDQYRREYPEDDQDLQDGYGVIADCIDHAGAPARAAAERWLDAHNGSTAKRYVLRYCLEPQP